MYVINFIRRYGGASTSLGTGTDLSRSRSSHALKSRETSPLRGAVAGSSADDKDGAALSSWARYLKNKYGNRSSKDVPREQPTTNTPIPSSSGNGGGAGAGSSSSSASRRLSLGLPLRQANDVASSDDDSKNAVGSPTTPT